MLQLTVGDVAQACEGVISEGNGEQSLGGVAVDSRQVEPGDLFVALRGERVDGHDYLEQAARKGAVAALVSKKVSVKQPLTQIIVNSSGEALLELAAWYRRQFPVTVVAVTGSIGKTTTKELIAAVLSQRWQVLKNVGNYNTEIGVPLTLFQLREGHQVAVIEMGMRGAGQIRRLAQVVAPQMGVVTNVDVTHIELLGSLENIAKAKAELVVELPPDGIAVLNGDDPRVRAMGATYGGKIFFYGRGSENDYFARDIQTQPGGTVDFVAHTPQGCIDVHLPLPGQHNVPNALAALAVGSCFGLDLPSMVRGLATCEPVAMRLNIVPGIKGITVINDAYNANPTSMVSGLTTLVDLQGEGRTIAVLGDMLELGPLAPEAHRQVGEQAAQCGIDILVVLGKWRGDLALGALEAGMAPEKVRDFATKADAIAYLQRYLEPADRVLVKASRGMALEEIVTSLTGAKIDEGE